jgi:hypothetical protein
MLQAVCLYNSGQTQAVQDLILTFERGKAFWYGTQKDFENDRPLVQRTPRAIHGGSGTGVQLGVEMVQSDREHQNVLY